MNDDELMVMIWLMIGMGLWIVRLKWVNRKLNKQLAAQAALPVAPAPATVAEPERDREMTRLRDRVAVLERITVEKENTLARQIDELRHST